MNPSEAAILLTHIAASDNREVTESASRAWAAALPDVVLADALDYLPTFYRTATRDTKNWIYPGDVLAGVVKLHEQRRLAAGSAAYRAIVGCGVVDLRGDEEKRLRATRAFHDACADYDEEHSIPDFKPPAPKRQASLYETTM